jgi:sugar lactone lactonase YvrE
MNRLDSVAALALSPNGTLLYSVASDARSVCALARDPALGSLTLTQCLVDPALAGARDLKVTADGNRLLVAATDAHSLVWIDLAGWPLPPLGALGSVSGLVGAGALALSPDEQDVYVASVAGQRVSHLRRSGPAYTLVDDYLVSMGGKTDVWVPPDGSAVFASNLHQHAVHRLTRDPLDGTLSDVSTFPLSTAGAGIQSPLGLTGSADGRTLYATSLSGHVTALWVDRGPVVDAIHSIGPGQPFRAAGVVAWSPTGDLYALTGGGGLLRLGRDPRSGAVRLLDQTSIQPEYRTFLVVTAKRIHLLGRQGAAARYGLDLAFQGSDVLPLSRVNDVVLSPDGTQLLAVSDADEALVALAIQPVNGSLYEIDRLDASDGLHDLLSEGYGIAISPDGARVYVASSRPRVAPPGVGGQVGVFDRALPGGELSFRGSHPTGREGSAHQVPQIAVSPDGRHVYATGIHGEDLYAWEETGTTLVGPVSTLLDGVDGVSGLVAVHDLAVSSDGRQVMTAAVRTTSTPGSVTLFHRDPVTGALSLRRSLQQLPGLDSPNGLLSAPAGHHLYVADAGTFQTPRGGIFVLDASALFLEGFETGDSSAWSASTP